MICNQYQYDAFSLLYIIIVHRSKLYDHYSIRIALSTSEQDILFEAII